MKDGEVKDNGRWCESHQAFHGILYQCEKYPSEILEHLKISHEKYMRNLRSKAWCKEQMDKNKIDAFGIEVFRAMAGIELNDWTE